MFCHKLCPNDQIEIVFSNIFNFSNNTLNYVCKPSVDIASPWSSFIKYSAEKILINKFLNYFCLNLRLTIASQCLPSSCQILQNLHFTTRFRLNYWQFSPSSSDVDTFFTNYSMFSFHHQLHLHPQHWSLCKCNHVRKTLSSRQQN